jgi:hypothetical protein
VQATHLPPPLGSHVVPVGQGEPLGALVAPNASHTMICAPEQVTAPGTHAVHRLDPAEHVDALGQVARSS